MKLKLTTLFFLFVITISAQENPFESIGKQGKILTLSNGKYKEIHSDDSLQQIGSVLINMNTGKIHEFIIIDTLYSEATLDPTVISRWYSLDALAAKYTSISPYSFVNNNPVLLVEIDGNEWINVHAERVKEIEKSLIDNPDNKKLQRQLKRETENAKIVNNIIGGIKENDPSLYQYIETLVVLDSRKKENVSVKVAVSLGSLTDNDYFGQNAQTSYSDRMKDGSIYFIEYSTKEDEGVVDPLDINTFKIGPVNSKDEIGFDIKLFGYNDNTDATLANEIGDVMYRMEYPAASQKSGSDIGKSRENYIAPGSAGDYSFRVEDTYKQRKKDGSGKDKENNPYPIKNRKEGE